jgi:leader peptidase (prepilin peptidase) / N-methyltransferase
MVIDASVVLFYFVLLLCLGSTLGCLSWRLAKRKEALWKLEAQSFLGIYTDALGDIPVSFFQGRSCCISCHHTLAVRDMVPVISYLLSKGRCRFCHEPVSIRYPVIELSYTLLLAPLLWIATSPLELLVLMLLFSALALAAIVDIEHLFIPDEANMLILVCGFLLPMFHHDQLENHVLGMLVGYGLLYLLRIIYLYIRKIEMIGLGDAKLLSAIGAWLGVMSLSSIILVASVSAIAFILLKGNWRDSKIPFGPFIAGAGVVVFYSHLLTV